MIRIFNLVLAFGILASLCGCSQNNTKYTQLPLEPLPGVPIDPDDSLVTEAVTAFLKDSDAPVASTYEFSRFDLDEDGRRDVLVLFKTPYGYWCGMHGCTLLVLKARDESFELVNAIQPIREPLYVSDLETNGWKNLIVRVSGRWDKAKDVAMQFDGKGYPNNPSNLPPYLRYAYNDDVRLFHD